MKSILVLVANYPNNEDGIMLMYVHVRNKYYIQHGLDVTVLNFAAKKNYIKDGIKVITLSDYVSSNNKYEALILHAPNIRNHYIFLKKYENRFEHIFFFFHGHEVLKINKTYPRPYDYRKTHSWTRMKAQDGYDLLKLAIWKKYLPKIAAKSEFIFVSNCFYDEFKKYTGLDKRILLNHVHIINNSVGHIFEEKSYNSKSDKKYDFITIRNMLDESVYCVDMLCEAAKNNPDKNFLLIGKGQYFEHHNKPENIEWIDKFLSQEELLAYIDQAKCALMLTRRDTQGVMACELMTYGIPLLTSNLPICHEVFAGIKNVSYISNNQIGKLNESYNGLIQTDNKNTKYFACNTISKEVSLIMNSRGQVGE